MKKVITLTLVLYAISFFGQEKPLNLKRGEVTEDYFGRKVTDPYRTIENSSDSMIIGWLREESLHANKTLDQISNRDTLLNTMLDFSNRKSIKISNVKITESQQYFYLKYNKETDKEELFYKDKFTSKETFLYSPVSYREDLDRDYTINYINPSWDGKKVAVSLSYDGKEISDIIIIDVKTKEVLPEVITQAWPRSFLGVNWLPDNSGFTYMYFPKDNFNSKDFKDNSSSVLYKLGSDPNKRKIILSYKSHPNLMEEDDYPATQINSSSDRYIIGYLAGVDNFWDAYYTEIDNLEKEVINWKPLFKKKDKVYVNSGQFYKDQFIYMSAKNASNFKLAQVSLKELDFDTSKVIVQERGNEVINDFKVLSSGIYYTTLKNGVKAKFYTINNNLEETEIELPYQSGEITLDGISNKPQGINISLGSWTKDYVDYFYDIENGIFNKQDIVTNVDFPEFKAIVVEELEVSSHDGVSVPLTILYNKNIKKNGKTPVLITGYGAYGDSYTAYFSPTFLSYVSEGGIFAIAHVRGGGEKGDTWHKGGYKTTKPNSWKDLIACTEYLIDKGFTSAQKVAITSGSAGGITIGRAMTERPDLFGAVISQVGQMNPMRNEFRPGGGGGNYKEYGTIKDSIECMALIEMDPYLNIKDKGVNYPATLLTAGSNDPRIPVWVTGQVCGTIKGQ